MKHILFVTMLLVSTIVGAYGQETEKFIGELPNSNSLSRVYEISLFAEDSLLLMSGEKHRFDCFYLFKLRGFILVNEAKIPKSDRYHGNLCYAKIKDGFLYIPLGPASQKVIQMSLKDTTSYLISDSLYLFIDKKMERLQDNREVIIYPFRFYFTPSKKGVKIWMDKEYYKTLQQKGKNLPSNEIKTRVMNGLW